MGTLNQTCVGNHGEALGVAHFTAAGYRVLLPFGGGYAYDFVLEKDGKFMRVQAKYTTYFEPRYGTYELSLRCHGHGRTHRRDADAVDAFWIATPTLCWLIPAKALTQVDGRLLSTLTLTAKYDRYIQQLQLPSQKRPERVCAMPRSCRLDDATYDQIWADYKAGKYKKHCEIAEKYGQSMTAVRTFLWQRRKREQNEHRQADAGGGVGPRRTRRSDNHISHAVQPGTN